MTPKKILHRMIQKLITQPSKWLLFFLLGFMFFIWNPNHANAQFIGADFQYSVHTVELSDTAILSAADHSPLSSVNDPNQPLEFKVVLKLYFNCRHEDFHTEQPITVHEHIGAMETLQLALKLDSVSTSTEYLSVSCEMANEQCLKTATYSGVVALKKLAGGYDISWGTCCWETSVKNINNLEMQGLAMFLHLPFPVDQLNNSSPVFLRTPQMITCPEKIMLINAGAIDRDGDKLSYKLIQPYTFQQEVGSGNSKLPELFPGQNTHTPLIVGRPPFKKNKYASGYTQEKPLGESVFSIDETTGSINATPTESGQYLVGIGVSEYRNDILLGETQRVFLFEVLGILFKPCNQIFKIYQLIKIY